LVFLPICKCRNTAVPFVVPVKNRNPNNMLQQIMYHPEAIPGPPLSWGTAAPGLEAGRQAVRDLEDVREVSASQFPRNLPQVAGLSYAAVCMEARQAGGDYYDFFDRGPHRLGFAVGDVSGKGIASAIVRATLQASLRTLSTMGWTDPGQALAVVNRLLFDSAPEAMYATLFLAEYDQRSHRLQYVNCGHPAPIVYGQNGLSRLQPNATVLGLFDEWQCTITEVQLAPGDTVLLYTDGASETMDDSGQEFGEHRLADLLQTHAHLPPSALLQNCLDQVRRFEGDSERDDLTLIALRLSISSRLNVAPVKERKICNTCC
jgi:serine phosphatase RsbU (regulator of sigma subunit)